LIEQCRRCCSKQTFRLFTTFVSCNQALTTPSNTNLCSQPQQQFAMLTGFRPP
jgi:hypothetical protein